MSAVLAAEPGVFLGLTLVIFGGAAVLVGRAVADNWKPLWQVVLYVALLGAVDRFLVFALFGGGLLSLYGYLLHTAVLQAMGLLAFRLTLARKMVRQYPWLYEQAGLLGWRERER